MCLFHGFLQMGKVTGPISWDELVEELGLQPGVLTPGQGSFSYPGRFSGGEYFE